MKKVRVGIVAVISLLMSQSVWSAPINVDSLEALFPYLEKDNVQVVMKPGTYRFTAEEAKAGKYGFDSFEAGRKTLMLIKGSGSTYDFTDVTIEVETGVFSSMGKFKIYELQTMGNHNVIKNLTLTDVGSVHDAGTVGVISVVMDGANNRIEGMHISTRGSFPFGYGELFGKSGDAGVKLKKHSAFLIRGNSNHAKDCSLIHRGFGHAYVMQAADKPLIEGCYAEGEMRKTDDVLAEKGTLAEELGYMTTWGYKIPPGFMYCTSEAGIRAYNTGRTYIDGETLTRGTSNPTVLNCTIKNLRAGVTLTHATGKKYVEGTSAIGCSRGFCIGSGDIVDCYADVQYGPALGVDYERDSGTRAEITLLPYEGKSYNGSGQVAHIIGKNHTITLKSQVKNPDTRLVIQIGGDKKHIGGQGEVEHLSATDISIQNESGYPVVLEKESSDCTGASVGKVTDRGRNNEVKRKPLSGMTKLENS
jgi:hypothetical protein